MRIRKKAVFTSWAIISLLAYSDTAFSASWSSKGNGTWGSAGAPHSAKASQSIAEASNSDPQPFSPGSHNFAVDLGQVMLVGDLSKFQNNLGAQIHYSYGVSDLFSFDSAIGYSEHSVNPLVSAPGSFLSMASLQTGVRTNLNWYDKIIPYASFGVGFYRPSMKLSSTTEISNILFGLYVGPGVDLQISDRAFFGTSLTLNSIFGSTIIAQGKAIELGGTYMNFMVHAGVSF
ncbi:MAG: hypothetical protein KA715_00750 [Xanthomonadaceae bacterium]|nr:hypothetical protein [Xanthomonadaceae bacterium]